MSEEFVSVQVSGLDAIHAQLLQLQAETAAKVLVASAKKAFLPVLWSARGKVPVDSGSLRDSLKIAVAKSDEGDLICSVGITIGKKEGGKPGELAPSTRWHFIELGTVKIPATPYLRPALDENASGVVEILKDELTKRIARAVKAASRGSK